MVIHILDDEMPFAVKQFKAGKNMSNMADKMLKDKLDETSKKSLE